GGGRALRILPPVSPPCQTVSARFRLWRLAGVWARVHAALREDVRLEAGAPPTPATLRVDSQTVKTTHRGGPKGYDGGKKGRRPQAVPDGRLPRTPAGPAGPAGGRPGPGRRAMAGGVGPRPVPAAAGGDRRRRVQ